jgi:hypothetical protein
MKSPLSAARPLFPLFQTPIDLAHALWTRVIQKGDHAVDATCGNGHDTEVVARLLDTAGGGRLSAFDIQSAAIEVTKKKCSAWLTADSKVNITFYHQSHASFPTWPVGSIGLIIYNLGYLPGGDKSITTSCGATIESLHAALPLVRPGGLISVTCYPGHAEGKKEEALVIAFAEEVSPIEWSCCHHRWVNRRNAPSLMLFQRAE